MEQEPVREPEEKSALLTLLPEMAQWSRVPGARFEVEMVVLRESPSLMREGEEEMEYVGSGVVDVSEMETGSEVATKFLRSRSV